MDVKFNRSSDPFQTEKTTKEPTEEEGNNSTKQKVISLNESFNQAKPSKTLT